jgi:NitT/TauT family transport system permease protein
VLDYTIALATLATASRIFLLIGVAIISGWVLAYIAIRSRRFESIYVPLVNVFESIPVIAFLPIVLAAFVLAIPGTLGVEIAVDFLVFDAVSWNIWIGAYQAFKTVPEPLLQVTDNYRFSSFRKLWELFIPHSMPRLASNMFASFADGFFYISVSEVFTAGVVTAKVCPGGTCSTFGIGSEIVRFLSSGNYVGVYYSLLAIAIAVVVATILLSMLSRWAVARFGVDTPGVIKHGKKKTHETLRRVRRQRLILDRRYIAPIKKKLEQDVQTLRSNRHNDNNQLTWPKYLLAVLGVVVLGYILYSSFRLVTSISLATWMSYFAQTPTLLAFVALDYVRVSIIALAALGLAMFGGYYLATRPKIGNITIPIIQSLAAFPAPTYFPLIFIATVPWLENAFPFFWTEIYIFALGFLSCFYYIFFDFWIAVQSVPVEFSEIMSNYQMPFWKKMRHVILPAALPYIITGLSSTINSAWAGLAIGEFWPNITPHGPELVDPHGMMYYISFNMAAGRVGSAAYVALLFAIVVAIYGIVFTRNLMDLARKKYVVEEGIFAS